MAQEHFSDNQGISSITEKLLSTVTSICYSDSKCSFQVQSPVQESVQGVVEIGRYMLEDWYQQKMTEMQVGCIPLLIQFD